MERQPPPQTYDDPDGSALARGRMRDATIQQVIDGLRASCRGRPEAEVVGQLERGLATRGLTDLPPRWLAAVAAALVSGETYAVSASTDRRSE